MPELKDLEYYMNLPYPVLLWDHTNKGAHSYWFAEIPDLPGCCADGYSPNEAIREIREAKRVWIAAHINSGFEVPEPTQSGGGTIVLAKKVVPHRIDLNDLHETAGKLISLLNDRQLGLHTWSEMVDRALDELRNPKVVEGGIDNAARGE